MDAAALYEDAPCGLLQTDADGLIARANRTFCRWVGWERGDLEGHRRVQDFFTMGGRIFHQTHWLPLLQMQGSVSEVKLDFVHRDGHTFPVVLNAVRREEDGVLFHDLAAYVAHDRNKYERELVLSRRNLEAAIAQAKDRALLAEQMVGIVSHDLRNPLSTIAMGTMLLRKQGIDERQSTVLGRIERAGDRANRLISQLLDFTQARLGSGLKVSPRAIDLHAVVHECVDELSLAFAGRDLRHEPHGEGECKADPDRLAQLIGNLVANAMAYGDASRPVTVMSAVSGERFEIAVHNWGPPIAQQTMATLFEPLSRGQDGGDVRSVGLGLYIVEQIAKAHGGNVDVRTAEAAGTTFTANFPR